MSNSLRDQLLGLGFKSAPPTREARPGKRDERGPRSDAKGGRPGAARPDARGARNGEQARRAGAPARPAGGRPRTREDIDLAKAYAIRAQREKEERIAAEAAKQEEARKRREARAKLAELVKDRTLNAPDAEIARHFPYGSKIKRVYVTAEQLKALNAGELGVLQIEGRYVLVDATTLAEAEAIFPAAIALKVDPDAPIEDDPYADPKYQVPDDLVW